MAVAEPPTIDEIAPIPVEDKAPNSEEPVKRRRGRPPGSKNKTYGGQPVGSRRARANSLEKEIGGLLVVINLPLSMVPMLQRDALDATEITALAKAIDQECQNNPTFRKYVEQALKVQGGTNLLFVVAAIAARRVIRHGVIPEEVMEPVGGAETVDLLIGQAIAASTNISVFKATPVTPPEPEPVVSAVV